MATIVEREIHHGTGDASDSSAMTMIVAIVALILIAGFALFFFQVFPFNGVTPASDNGTTIDIDLPNGTPTPDSM